MSKKVMNNRNFAIMVLVLENVVAFLIGTVYSNQVWQFVCILLVGQNIIFAAFLYVYTKQFENNQIEITVARADDFEIAVLGFDPNRDVIVDSIRYQYAEGE